MGARALDFHQFSSNHLKKTRISERIHGSEKIDFVEHSTRLRYSIKKSLPFLNKN